MADSNITKQALSAALKELMEEHSFDKISVSDICEKCHMNRKSFYYHFRDKYDLANWIFDTEFLGLLREHSIDVMDSSNSYNDRWNSLETICQYFYQNRNFYRKILKVEGQNSFTEHFRDFLYPIMRTRVESLLGQKDVPQMVYDFVVDGIVCAIERWLLDKNCISSDELMYNLKRLLQLLIAGMNRRIADDPKWLEELQ